MHRAHASRKTERSSLSLFLSVDRSISPVIVAPADFGRYSSIDTRETRSVDGLVKNRSACGSSRAPTWRDTSVQPKRRYARSKKRTQRDEKSARVYKVAVTLAASPAVRRGLKLRRVRHERETRVWEGERRSQSSGRKVDLLIGRTGPSPLRPTGEIGVSLSREGGGYR